AQTDDFQRYRKLGVVGPDVFDRNAVLFPEMVGGKLILIHRAESDIQIAFFDDLDHLLDPGPEFWPDYLRHLDDHKLLTQVYPWEAKKIGASCPPLQTPEGWLLIYHGVDMDHVYRAGAALLDLDDPRRVIARTAEPILEPEAPYELVGDVPNVVFPQGLVVLDRTAYVYYGGADKVVALATAPLADLVTYLTQDCMI
ncbi:MAG: glycosidase, partial [Anaerolineae bacterium]|nr:glycosidase [Anaerolineae bacterium]